MNELEHLKNKFFYKNNTAQVFGELNQEEFNKLISSLKSYERPDILSMYDNKIFGIEHFEFDSYNRSNSKGSDYKIKDYRIEKIFDKEIKEKLENNDSIILHDEIKSTATLNNYYKNFENIFKVHYKKIQSYIDHIDEEFDCEEKEVHICFFAEDVTPLGNYFWNDNDESNLSPMLPIYSNAIRQLLDECPLVEFLIIGSFFMNDNKLFIIRNNKETLDKLANDYNEIRQEKFFNFKPQTTGFAFKIQKKK